MSQFRVRKDDSYLYQFQSYPVNPITTGTTAPNAWDDGETQPPILDVRAEPYAPSLAATQAASFSCNWNNRNFSAASPMSGFVNVDVLQEPRTNPSPLTTASFDPPSVGRTASQGETSTSWPVQKLSPASVPSIDSSAALHRGSFERPPLQQPEKEYQRTQDTPKPKTHSDSSLEGDNHSNSSNSRGQSAKVGKKRPFLGTEFVRDGPEGSKGAKRSKKVAHHTVEKRYRMNLNSKIAELRESIPSLRSAKTNLSDEEQNGAGDGTPGKGLRKAQVLSKANEYIHEVKREARQLRNENEALRKKLALLRIVAASEEPDASPEALVQSPSSAGSRRSACSASSCQRFPTFGYAT